MASITDDGVLLDPVDASQPARRRRGRVARGSTLIRTPASSPRISAAGRVELEDPAVVHDRNPVAQHLGLVHVVGREHDRPAVLVEAS